MQKSFIVTIVLVLGVAVFFSMTNSQNGFVGRQVLQIPQEDTECTYKKDLENYVETNENPTGNSYCRSKGYAYAAFVERSFSRILFDSTNGQCFSGGNIQVDEIQFPYTLAGNVPLGGWSGSQCFTNTNQGFVEPEYGDRFTISRYEGALCCYT